MKQYLKYAGRLLTFADKLIPMEGWFANEGNHYLRVKAGSGVTKDRNLTEDIYKMEEEYSFPPTLVGVLPESGRVERASGIYRFASKLFSLAGVTNDVIQPTANSQPYLFKNGIKNPNGGSRFMTHPTISFAANQAWSVSFISKYNGGDGSLSALTAELFGTNTDNNNRFLFKSGSSDYRFGFTNNIGNYIAFNGESRKVIGKLTYCNLIADGSGNLSLYLNGLLDSTKLVSTGFVLNAVLAGRYSSFFPGNVKLYTIRSGALTPEQITAEYNLLSSYFPEISTVQVGSKHIATDNCEMVATPKGNVINLNNLAANTELITNAADREFSSDTGFWTKSINTNIDTGVASIVDAAHNLFQLTRFNVFTVGKYYKISFDIKNKVTGGVRLFGLTHDIIVSVNGNYDLYALASNSSLGFVSSNTTGLTTLQIDNVSVVEVGFAGAADLYTAIYNQTSGTVAQKTLAALKAAAMWRSPDSDLDKQAVYGKLFNGYAKNLLALDIATYNTENPSDPWGYDIIEEADLVELGTDPDALKDTEYWSLGTGTNVTGFSAYPAGVILTNGNYMGFGDVAAFWTKDSPLDLRLGASIRLKKV